MIDGLTQLADRADTVVLAQASMARVVDRLPEMVRAKVLSSPELAIEALSPCVDELPADLRDGVLKVDDPLMQSAVSRGERTIIAATNAATLEPSAQTLQKAGSASGKTVNAEMSLIPDAFDAFLRWST